MVSTLKNIYLTDVSDVSWNIIKEDLNDKTKKWKIISNSLVKDCPLKKHFPGWTITKDCDANMNCLWNFLKK